METIYALEQYFLEEENRRKAERTGYKSARIQDFIRDYCYINKIDEISEDEIWNILKINMPDINVKRSYFKSVCKDAWVIFTDKESGERILDLTRQKVIKERKNNRRIFE